MRLSLLLLVFIAATVFLCEGKAKRPPCRGRSRDALCGKRRERPISRRKPPIPRRRQKRPIFFSSLPSSSTSIGYSSEISTTLLPTGSSTSLPTPPLPWKTSPSSSSRASSFSPKPTSTQDTSPLNEGSSTKPSSGASSDSTISTSSGKRSTETPAQSLSPGGYTGVTADDNREKFYAFNSDTGSSGSYTFTPPPTDFSTDNYSGESSQPSSDGQKFRSLFKSLPTTETTPPSPQSNSEISTGSEQWTDTSTKSSDLTSEAETTTETEEFSSSSGSTSEPQTSTEPKTTLPVPCKQGRRWKMDGCNRKDEKRGEKRNKGDGKKKDKKRDDRKKGFNRNDDMKIDGKRKDDRKNDDKRKDDRKNSNGKKGDRRNDARKPNDRKKDDKKKGDDKKDDRWKDQNKEENRRKGDPIIKPPSPKDGKGNSRRNKGNGPELVKISLT